MQRRLRLTNEHQNPITRLVRVGIYISDDVLGYLFELAGINTTLLCRYFYNKNVNSRIEKSLKYWLVNMNKKGIVGNTYLKYEQRDNKKYFVMYINCFVRSSEFLFHTLPPKKFRYIIGIERYKTLLCKKLKRLCRINGKTFNKHYVNKLLLFVHDTMMKTSYSCLYLLCCIKENDNYENLKRKDFDIVDTKIRSSLPQDFAFI